MDALVVEPRRSERLGVVENPADFFAAEKQRLLDKIGDISDIQVTMNRILVAIWIPEEGLRWNGGKTLILPDSVKDEDVFQCSAGLVLKMGAHAYNPQPGAALTFYDSDRCEVGDWVMFRRGEGIALNLWRNQGDLMESERGIKLVVGRPDAVY